MKAIVLPKEHGGWSFLVEPILLGTLVAPTFASVCFSITATAGFLMRHPLKLFLRNRRQQTAPQQYRGAGVVAFTYGIIALAGFVAALLISGWRPIIPLVLLSPFTAIYLSFDAMSLSRRLLPELSGPLALAAFAPSIALAADWSWLRASALWIVLMARTIPSIFYVRARLRLERGQLIHRKHVFWCHLGFLAVVVLLAWRGLVPLMTLFGLLFLMSRAIYGLSSHRRLTKTKQIGILEIIFGLIYISMVIVGFSLRI